MNRYDRILFLILLILAAAAYFGFRLINRDVGAAVQIMIDGEEYETLQLEKDGRVEIKSRYGLYVLEIEDGCVDMVLAPCPDKICVNHKKIQYDGESIVCLPGRVIAQIIGGETGQDKVTVR